MICIALLRSMLLYVSVVCAGCAAASPSATPSPLSKLKIDGVALEMTSSQALRALKERGIVPLAIKAPCVSDYIAMHQSTVSLSDHSGRCFSTITAKTASGSLLISFVEDLPRHPGKSTITSIAFNRANPERAFHSPELEQSVRQAGAPSLTDGKKPWVIAMWCAAFKCKSIDQTLRDANSGVVLLMRRGEGLSFTFDSYAAQRRNAAYEILSKHHIKITD